MPDNYWTTYQGKAYSYCAGCGWAIREGDAIYVRQISLTALCANCGPDPIIAKAKGD